MTVGPPDWVRRLPKPNTGLLSKLHLGMFRHLRFFRQKTNSRTLLGAEHTTRCRSAISARGEILSATDTTGAVGDSRLLEFRRSGVVWSLQGTAARITFPCAALNGIFFARKRLHLRQ